MGILSDAPQGFASAVASLNSLPQGLLAELCQDVIAFLQYRVGFINTENYDIVPKFDNAKILHDLKIVKGDPTNYLSSFSALSVSPKPNVKECINALTFIFRTAALSSLSVDSLGSELKDSLEWGDGALAVVKHVWKEEGPALCGMPKETLNIGQLVSMNWKLGVAMSSSSCRSLSTPYISLQLRMSESAGTTQLHSIEMTVPEFQNFATQLKDMASTLETSA